MKRDDKLAELAEFSAALAPLLDKARKLAALDKEIVSAQAEMNVLAAELSKARREKSELDSAIIIIKKKFRGEVV